MILQTERLLLRQWRDTDHLPFARMSASAEVMRYFPALLSQQESIQLAQHFTQLIQQNGWGFWAVELKSNGEFIGVTGLHRQELAIPHAPFIEVGWRFAEQYWHQGYATEAAAAALKFAFTQLAEAAVYAFTAVINEPSKRVMQRLGMTDLHTDFNHPKLSPTHPLARHCLYRITTAEWRLLTEKK